MLLATGNKIWLALKRMVFYAKRHTFSHHELHVHHELHHEKEAALPFRKFSLILGLLFLLFVSSFLLLHRNQSNIINDSPYSSPSPSLHGSALTEPPLDNNINASPSLRPPLDNNINASPSLRGTFTKPLLKRQKKFKKLPPSGENDAAAADDDASLVREVIAENPADEKGERLEWSKGTGVGRKEVVHNHKLPLGSYGGSCTKCSVSSSNVLTCLCASSPTSSLSSSLILSSCPSTHWIGNAGGKLVCERVPTGEGAKERLRRGGHKHAAEQLARREAEEKKREARGRGG